MSPLRAHVPRLGAMAALPLLVAVHAASVPPAVDGWAFTWKTTSTGRGMQSSTMQVRLAGDQMRVDFEKPMPGMQTGTYMLVDADTKQMTMVSPSEKKATILPMGGFASMLGALGGRGMLKLEPTNITVNVKDEGPGESILGHATHKYQVSQSYDITMTVMGFTRSTKANSESEMWLATDLPDAEQRVLQAFARNFATSFGGAMGGGMQKLSDALSAKLPKGFPLKQVTTMKGGRGQEGTTTMEATEFGPASIDPAIFEVPSSYAVSDMAATLDSAAAARPDTGRAGTS